MRPTRLLRWTLAALGLCAASALAAPPRNIIVTREIQDLYRVATGTFYLKTLNCHEHVYEDRADLRPNAIGKGAMLLFRNGRQCVVEKFFQEVDASKITVTAPF
jgi:hypothetical protein